MSKQKKKKEKVVARQKVGAVASSSLPLTPLQFLSNKKNQLWIVFALACALYTNTLFNQFALDDGMVLRDNHLVLKGVSAIPDILTHDSFYGAIGVSANLAGGRYRPLSLVSFAIEVTMFGEKPFVHHLINVFLYGLTAVVLLNFLSRFIFPKQPMASFIATLLFVFHPIHTEVVANIKSRDEIFSLLFLLLTLHYLLLYLRETKRSRHFVLSMLFYFLALFSKENGLIFVVMIPLTVFFFTAKKIREIILTSLPFIGLVVLYGLIRYMLLGAQNNMVMEVMDNPYVLATASQKFGTILYVFLLYLQLLFFPHPLTYDYSFQQIPYRDFSNPLVLLSLAIYISLGVYALIGLRKKDIISWCIIFYFGTIFIVSNLFFNVGAPLADRFLYQASVPFVIVIVELFRRLLLTAKPSKKIAAAFISILLAIIFISSSYATITRNADWKTDESIFLHDVKISSNSARANTYAGISLIRISDMEKDSASKRSHLLKSLEYFKAAKAIKPDYLPTLLNTGVAYSKLDSIEAAESVWNEARRIEPANQNFPVYDNFLYEKYFHRGEMENARGNSSAAISYFQKALKYKPNDANTWSNIGLIEGGQKNYSAAITAFESSVKSDSSRADLWYNLGGAYFSVQKYDEALSAWEKALQLNPKYTQAIQGIAAIKSRLRKQ